MFAVQSSDDPSFFGGEEQEPNFISYYFGEEHLPEIEQGIAKCLEVLGENKKRLDIFFNTHGTYNNKQIEKELDTPLSEIPELLEWYARVIIGEKILACVKENGACSFDAELW